MQHKKHHHHVSETDSTTSRRIYLVFKRKFFPSIFTPSPSIMVDYVVYSPSRFSREIRIPTFPGEHTITYVVGKHKLISDVYVTKTTEIIVGYTKFYGQEYKEAVTNRYEYSRLKGDSLDYITAILAGIVLLIFIVCAIAKHLHLLPH